MDFVRPDETKGSASGPLPRVEPQASSAWNAVAMAALFRGGSSDWRSEAAVLAGELNDHRRRGRP